jgi:hypothetical protein
VCASFKIDELVITGISKMIIQPDPFISVEKRFAGKCPALQVELLEFIPVALQHNISLLSNAFNFFNGNSQFLETQIM